MTTGESSYFEITKITNITYVSLVCHSIQVLAVLLLKTGVYNAAKVLFFVDIFSPHKK